MIRFKNGLIYTYIGEVCISVNPYKEMELYNKAYVNQYKVYPVDWQSLDIDEGWLLFF